MAKVKKKRKNRKITSAQKKHLYPEIYRQMNAQTSESEIIDYIIGYLEVTPRNAKQHLARAKELYLEIFSVASLEEIPMARVQAINNLRRILTKYESQVDGKTVRLKEVLDGYTELHKLEGLHRTDSTVINVSAKGGDVVVHDPVDQAIKLYKNLTAEQIKAIADNQE